MTLKTRKTSAGCRSPSTGNALHARTHSFPSLEELVNRVVSWCKNHSVAMTSSEERDFLLVQFDSAFRVVDVQENPLGEDGGPFSVCWSLGDTTKISLEFLAWGIEENILPSPQFVEVNP